MINLVKNELMKIFSGRLTKILFLLLIIVAVSFSVFAKIAINKETAGNWRTGQEQIIEKNNGRLQVADLSPQLQAEAKNKVAIAEYRLKNNIAPQENNLWYTLLHSSGLFEWVVIFTIIIAANIVAREYTDGTMKLLLIRPHSRGAILFSKYTAVVIYAVFSLILTIGAAYITIDVLYGFGSGIRTLGAAELFINSQGQIESLNIFRQCVKMYCLDIFPIMSYVTISFAVSTILKSSAVAVGSSLLLMILGNSMIEATSKLAWLKFLPFANSDMSLYIFHLQPREEMTIGFSVSVLLIYIIVLFGASFAIFKKRDVSI
jgi:ABC-2 type transport system permease protein